VPVPGDVGLTLTWLMLGTHKMFINRTWMQIHSLGVLLYRLNAKDLVYSQLSLKDVALKVLIVAKSTLLNIDNRQMIL
jgi:hypothetical protein